MRRISILVLSVTLAAGCSKEGEYRGVRQDIREHRGLVCPEGTRIYIADLSPLEGVYCIKQNGERHGPHALFNEEGIKVFATSYVNGEPGGLFSTFHDNGRHANQGPDSRYPMGAWRFWSPEGGLEKLRCHDKKGRVVRMLQIENGAVATDSAPDVDVDGCRTSEIMPLIRNPKPFPQDEPWR